MNLLSERFNAAVAHWEKETGKKFRDSHMADSIGVTRATVGNWRGKGNSSGTMSGMNLKKSADYLMVSQDWLGENKGPMLPSKKPEFSPVERERMKKMRNLPNSVVTAIDLLINEYIDISKAPSGKTARDIEAEPTEPYSEPRREAG